ncbi:hypothetical protein RSW84_27500, partial [Escherichia coli]|uniref:hypothetical protein n=1 Tax=Escherichia coli TaxID=562 RepID=UPI0028DEC95E
DTPFDRHAARATGAVYAAQRALFAAADRGGADVAALEERAMFVLEAVLRQRAAAAPGRAPALDAVEEARRLINLEGAPRSLAAL